jgi:hypothetical protein
MTYTCLSAVNKKSQEVYGVYLDMNDDTIGSAIKLA